MKRRITVNPKARIAHIPKELIDAGLAGEVDGYADAVTLTIVNPNTPLKDVETSLKIVLKDIQFRRKLEREGNGNESERRSESALSGAEGDSAC